MSEPEPALDLVLETETSDPLGEEELERLADGLKDDLSRDATIAFAKSAVEMHGEPWWMCVYVWCMSERARQAAPAIARTGCRWATEWRRASPRRRPVYLALTDAGGRRIGAFLVREQEQRLTTPTGRRRTFPLVQRRYAPLDEDGPCI